MEQPQEQFAQPTEDVGQPQESAGQLQGDAEQTKESAEGVWENNAQANAEEHKESSEEHKEELAEKHAVFDLGEDEQASAETKRERLPSDYDVTEMELIQKREQADVERRAMLVDKERQEQEKKAETQQRAEKALGEWTAQRKDDIIQRRTQNKVEEESFNQSRMALNASGNPWEKVTGNIEVKEGNYQGSKDVSRMRQAIVSRRNDVKHGIMKFGESE